MISILVADSFKKNKSQTIYELRSHKTTYTLHFSKNHNISHFKTGDSVSIKGELQASNQNTSAINVNQIKLIKSFVPHQKMNLGVHKMLVLLLDFNDKQATFSTTIEQTTGHIFTAPNSVRKNFLESSASQVDFIPDTNGDGEPDVYIVNINYSINNSCQPSQWADDAKLQAEAQGIDISQYKHFMFLVPALAKCEWRGLAHVGCGKSCNAWVRWYDKTFFAHELGHNLGMSHASTDRNNDGKVDSEYGDDSGIMGNSGYHQVNAPHRIQMHWYDIFPNNIKTVSQSESFRLYSLDKAPNRNKKQIAIITKDGLSPDYYLSYRTNIGAFGMRDPYAKKINVHRFPGPNNRTLFIKPLRKGEGFIDPEEGLKFTAIKIKDNFGSVRVQYLPKCSFVKAHCTLQQNDSIDDLDGKNNYVLMHVPEGTGLLTIVTSATVSSPDVKLFVKHNEIPTGKDFDCKSQGAGGTQICALDNPKAGKWFIKIKSKTPHSGISLKNQIETSIVKRD